MVEGVTKWTLAVFSATYCTGCPYKRNDSHCSITGCYRDYKIIRECIKAQIPEEDNNDKNKKC